MKINPSFYVMAGMLFGRGTLINPGQNCIVLYLFDTENELSNIIIKNFSEFEPKVKKIQLDKIGINNSINGIYIPTRYGREIKETLNIQKTNILDRKIPAKIINSDTVGISSFLSGFFSMNCNIEKKGIVFFRYPVITIKEVGIEALRAINYMLEKIDIKSEILDNSNKTYKIKNEEKVTASILTVKKENVKKFSQNIEILNPIKSDKLFKII